MEKFKCVGVAVSEPTGVLVKYSDVQNFCEELVASLRKMKYR